MKTGLMGSLVVALAAVWSQRTTAQCPYDWRPVEGFAGADYDVFAATAWDPDGSGPLPDWLVIGGEFSVCGDIQDRRVAAWDGRAWHALGPALGGGTGPRHAGTVFALAASAGNLFAAIIGVERWDGTTWHPLPGAPTSRVLGSYNGDLIAGGDFDMVAGESCHRIARWDGQSWHPLGGGLNGPPKAFAVYNGDLIVGGEFTSAGGASCLHVARWDGAGWHPLGTGTDEPVLTLAAYRTSLIAGGRFHAAGGSACDNIARWDGSNWHAFDVGLNGPVSQLARWRDGLVATGSFSLPCDEPECFGIARWDGATWQSMGAGPGGRVNALVPFHDAIVIAGDFEEVGPLQCGRLARWDGESWGVLGQGFAPTNLAAVTSLTTYGGDLVASGFFTMASGTSCSGAVRRTGGRWQQIGDDGRSAEAMIEYDHQLVAGGYSIKSWDGVSWRPLATVQGGSSRPSVYALATYHGDLIAGGEFSAIAGVSCLAAARWDGSAWAPLSITARDCNEDRCPIVRAMTIHHDELIAGGSFVTATRINCNNIAAWNGVTWHPLGSGTNGDVDALAERAGSLVAAGAFSSAGGNACQNIATWTGTAWRPLGDGVQGEVHALAYYAGDLFAAGNFFLAGTTSCNRIARWDGATWHPLGTGITDVRFNGHPFITGLTVHGGELVIGGRFTTAGGRIAGSWARWGPCCSHGDMNCDGVTDYHDRLLFVQALLNPAAYEHAAPGCDLLNADVNQDGCLDGLDVAAFLQAAIGD